MESFAVLLIMSLLFLGILFLGTSLMEGIPGGNVVQKVSKIDVASMPQFFLGFTKEDKARTINYDSFVIGANSSMNIREVLVQDIANGLFSYKDLSLEINLQPATVTEAVAGSVSLEITSTNNYGNLAVSWNGKEYYNDKPAAGKIDVNIPKEAIKESNTLIVKSTGPGARFWASSFYALQNVHFDIITKSKRSLFFDVFPEELPTWSAGVLNFRRADYSSADGTLKASINGKAIYGRFPKQTDSIEIGPSDIRSGKNVITLESDSTFSLSNVFLNVFLWRNRTPGVSTSFKLNGDDLFLLNSSKFSGVVEINVGSVLKPAAIEVRFNSSRGIKSIFITELKDTIDAEFGADQVNEGNNTMTLLSDGSMEIKSVDIFLQGG
ncbi:MAG: hypothetical protein V1836_01290 [Candidatus Aenigmatarchaeota archaeon]